MSRTLVIPVIIVGAVVSIMTPAAKPPVAQTASTSANYERNPAKPGRAVLETVIERSPNGHFYVDAEVNGQFVHFVVDTGATDVVLTTEDAKRVGINFSPSEFRVVARGASGDVMGQRVNINHIAIDQKEAFDLPAAVIGEGLDVSLLGQSFLSRIAKVEISNDRMILG